MVYPAGERTGTSAAVMATVGGARGRGANNGLPPIPVTSPGVHLLLKPLGRRHRPTGPHTTCRSPAT